MPKDFEKCVREGGRVKRKTLSGGRYINICFKDGKSYAGEVKTKKHPLAEAVEKEEVNALERKALEVVKINLQNAHAHWYAGWKEDGHTLIEDEPTHPSACGLRSIERAQEWVQAFIDQDERSK